MQEKLAEVVYKLVLPWSASWDTYFLASFATMTSIDYLGVLFSICTVCFIAVVRRVERGNVQS
jgi:hypothetical protein